MTKKEYLAALDQYLVTMSASEKADILSDYEEHFRVGLENGKTESQIAASLGSPYDVANQFLDGEKPKVPTYPTRPAASSAAAAPTIAAAATTAATTAAASRPAATASAAAPRPTTSASQPYATTQRPAAASQPYATTQRPAASASQPYAAAQRPAASASQPYAATQHPAAASQPYAATQRPTGAPSQPFAAPASQTNPYQQGVQPYRTAQAPAQTAARETYDAGMQRYTAPQEQRSSYGNESGYADYDRQAAERQYESSRPQKESQYNSTGIIVVVILCVVLIPTVGSTIVGLLVSLYGAVVGFATAGGSLIAVGTALSAASIWVCVGLVFIGISFLALTGLLVMASIEGTKLFVKLIKYCIKECKKMIREGSF